MEFDDTSRDYRMPPLFFIPSYINLVHALPSYWTSNSRFSVQKKFRIRNNLAVAIFKVTSRLALSL